MSLPITCTAANKLETESSAPFNVTVYCEYCSPVALPTSQGHAPHCFAVFCVVVGGGQWPLGVLRLKTSAGS